VDTDNSPFTYLCFSKTPAFSPSQKIRPFDQASDGMLIGEGLGMLVLKRLADAERDGDRIYAVIRGIGSSSDGKYKSIYAPRPSGQSLAIERAYQEAGLDPTDIQLVEAHGTGTKAGDPAEFAGLNAVFGSPNGKAQSIALGSVKSQIGHTKAAAGAAGLIKTALALHQKVLPPTINVSQPAESLELDQSYFYINSDFRPWFMSPEKETRKAAVSAFGFGGTNFHLVVEEYPGSDLGAYRLGTVPRIFLFSADTRSDLEKKLKSLYSDFLAGVSEQVPNAWKTMQTSPPDDQNLVRLGFVASGNDQLLDKLNISIKTLESQHASNSWDHPKGIHFRSKGISQEEKIAAVFPGQGSQYLNMLVKAVTNFPPLRQAFEEMDKIFHLNDQKLLSDVVYPIPAFDSPTEREQEGDLQETDYAQAGIGVISYGLFSLLKQAGFQPDFTAGHSFGELTALWAGGAINNESFFRLVKARGTAMRPSQDETSDPGAMAAVNGDYREIEPKIKEIKGVVIANQNSPHQVVLAGPTASIKKAEIKLSGNGYKVTLLPVSAAFHTELVSHATEPFRDAVLDENFQKPTLPVYSNTTGEPYPEKINQSKETLANHILHPVIFQTQIENIYSSGGRVFVEVGPRQILGNLISEILADQPHEVVSLNPSREKDSDLQLREAIMKLQVLGVKLSDFDPYQINKSKANKLQPIQEKL
jgi:polyketide-type polyunsaturated fatty acid synthase PfaA